MAMAMAARARDRVAGCVRRVLEQQAVAPLLPFGARAASNQLVRARMRSVNNTRKITMAMRMVAASKLRHMEVKAENSRGLWQPFTALLGDAPGFEGNNVLILVLSSDKGLCGGINSTSVKYARSLFKLTKAQGEGKDVKFTLIGDKGRTQLQREYSKWFSSVITETQKDGICFTQCAMIADEILRTNTFDVMRIVFNKIESVVSFFPTVATILSPAMYETEAGVKVCKLDDYEIEGDDSLAETMRNLAEFQLASTLYNGMLENATSELGARMSAMDNSTRNAGDVLNRLTLKYNRSRQSQITTELIEIISGAAALSG